MAGELARFVADPGRCGIVVVTQAEEMPIEEALELRRALHDRLGRAPEALVVNGLYPRLDGVTAGDENQLVSLWRRRRRLNERELARLAAEWEGPRLELPQLPIDRGPALIAALQRCILMGEGGGEGKTWS
jgi:DNA transposition AAA+ family ATPase